MPELTDDELGELLREAFAAQETLVDHLPEATKRRSRLPVLLAAAAVLVVLAGVLYGVHRSTRPDPAQPAATTATSEDGMIWGVAVATVLHKFEPTGTQWSGVKVFGQFAEVATSDPPKTLRPGVTFSQLEQRQIALAVAGVAPVVWNSSISPQTCAPSRVPTVVLDPIVDKGDHREVRVLFMLGCGGNSHSGVYTLRKVDNAWKVIAGTGDLCGAVRTTSATPRGGC